jgi:hypothetical protein
MNDNRSVSRRALALVSATLSVLALPASGFLPAPALAQEQVVLGRPIPGPVVPPPFYRAALDAGTRALDGRPGPNYWQVHTEYDIDARLDPRSGLLSGSETVRFHNRSPHPVPDVVLFLHQNIHAPGVARHRATEVTGGVRLERVRAGGVDLLPVEGDRAAGYRESAGTVSIRLPQPLRPGETAEMEIAWSFLVPQNGAGRMGHSAREMYFLAYWFPKVAVFDDLRGWDAEPYLGAEFYEGYGDYRVRLTVPNGWTVMATGELENPEAVYTSRTRARMAAAAAADTMVPIATRADRENGSVTELSPSGSLTYRFHARNVRDVVWTASSAQLWTGTSSRVPDRDGDGREDRVAIHSFWREGRAPLWERQALYAKHSIEFESRFTGFSYPWPHMTSVEGTDIIGGGMEYPMFTLIGAYQGRQPFDLYSVTAHELAHMWIPMIVGSNEKRHAWMDEGSTTFLENQTEPDYWPGIPDQDLEDMEAYLALARREGEQILMRHHDFYEPGGAGGTASYQKPATLLVALRSLLGEKAFMEAYQGFIRDWAYKHPAAWDFFNAFERVAGTDLDWFWQSFYYETWVLDHAVASVRVDGGDTVVEVEDRGWAFMPTRLRVETDRGTVLEREVPVSHWLKGEVRAPVRIPVSAGAVVRVVLDPDGRFPDVDRGNDVWERK